MYRSTTLWRSAVAALLATSFLAPTALAQGPASRFHEAYWLEREEGELERAHELYMAVAGDRGASAQLRARAKARARGVAEELACADFASLMPADTIFYAELNRPGEQLEGLMGQLGLLGDGTAKGIGISPKLIEGMLGVRGAAAAITEFDPREGPTNGVLIVHPGSLDVVRGLLETALPAAAAPVKPIGGHPTFDVEGQALVTLTSKLLVASRDRAGIEHVVARLAGEDRPCLATSKAAAGAMKLRGTDLMFFCLNLEPVMPTVQKLMRQATQREPEMAAAMAFLDVASTKTLAGHVGVGENGLEIDLAVELDEGHRNLAFNLLRMPNLSREALGMVPAGSAFFVAGALNGRGQIPGGVVDSSGRPAVTFMDFGREVFANVADFALYATPHTHRTPFGEMPEVALALRVNDVPRSQAIWDLILGSAQAATAGGSKSPEAVDGITRYRIAGTSVFVGAGKDRLVVSASEDAVDAALGGSRKSVLEDEGFAVALDHFGADSTCAMAAHVGRCAKIASRFMSERERREIEPIAGLMRNTAVAVRFEHGPRHALASARVTGIPNVRPMVEKLIAEETGRSRRRAAARRASFTQAPAKAAEVRTESVAAAPAPAPRAASRAAFTQLHQQGKGDAARQILSDLIDHEKDPQVLNDLAWALLTEGSYEGRYNDVALSMSKASNERSEWANWFYVDTFARACFENGDVQGAIRWEKKAIEIGAEHPRIGEAREQLKMFERSVEGAAPASIIVGR